MQPKENLSDERLAVLHQQKRVNAFFIIYNRYRNYGYAIIIRTLEKYKLVNALKEDKDAILYDSIIEALAVFNKSRGNFRQLLSAVIANQTASHIYKFKKDPLSDYISLDTSFREGSALRFADSIAIADKDGSPQEIINLSDRAEKVSLNYNGVYKRKISKIIKLKEAGYTYQEIAKKFKTTEKAIRSIFYRIKKQMNVKASNKIKK